MLQCCVQAIIPFQYFLVSNIDVLVGCRDLPIPPKPIWNVKKVREVLKELYNIL